MSKPPPSITAVVSLFPAPSQTFIQRKLLGLRDAGVPVAVASTTFGPGAADLGFPMTSLMPWRAPRVALEPASRAAWRATATALWRQRRIGSDLRERVSLSPLLAVESDVVHFEFSGIAVSYLDVLPVLRERSRLAVSCRGAAEQIEPLKDPSRADALAEVFSQVDLIHCVSDDMRRTVEQLGAPPDRILVNRPAVPVTDFVPLRNRPAPGSGPLRLLSIGRLHWKKGFDDGIRAVADARARGVDVEYRIAGEGPEREKLSFLIHELGLDGVVRLEGARTQQQIRELLGATDVLLLPSLSEGISNAVLEAMAAGLPVVVTDCGGMTEVVEDGVDGLVVPVGDLGLLAEHLAALAVDPELRARLGAAAAAKADEQLDLSHQVARFVEAYRALGA